MRSMGTIAMPFGSLIGGYAANVFSSQLILHSLASGFYLFLSYGYSIRNYEHCRKLMKLQRILLVFDLRKSAERCGFIAGMRVREIYIGDFSNISAQLELYRRFSQYIGATQIISAIFRLYRLNDKRSSSQTASSLYFEAPPEQSSLPFRAIN